MFIKTFLKPVIEADVLIAEFVKLKANLLETAFIKRDETLVYYDHFDNYYYQTGLEIVINKRLNDYLIRDYRDMEQPLENIYSFEVDSFPVGKSSGQSFMNNTANNFLQQYYSDIFKKSILKDFAVENTVIEERSKEVLYDKIEAPSLILFQFISGFINQSSSYKYQQKIPILEIVLSLQEGPVENMEHAAKEICKYGMAPYNGNHLDLIFKRKKNRGTP